MATETEGGGPAVLRPRPVASALFASALFASALATQAAVAAAAPRVEVHKLADTASVGEVFDFDVDAGGAVLLLTRDNICDAGSRECLFGAPLEDPAWVSLAGGKLRLIARGALFAAEGGSLRKLVDVPLKSPVAAADGERVFVAGITPEGRSVLFLHKGGQGHKPLLELDVPVAAMTIRRGALLFTAGPGIFGLKENGKAALLARLPAFRFIPSIAADDETGTIYFSDGESTFAMLGNAFVVVRQGMGGVLRFRNGNLYILSFRDRALFRLSGLSRALLQPGAVARLPDPCPPPVLSLYCESDRIRANLKALSALSRAGKDADPAAASELAAAAAEQKKELATVMAAMAKQAAGGTAGIAWGGGGDPGAVGAGAQVAAGSAGQGVTLWDGTEVRLGPHSTAAVEDCRPGGECRLSLKKGLLHVRTPDARAEEGAGQGAPRRFAVSTDTMTLGFESGEVTLHSDGETATVVVIEGRVKATSPGGGSATLVSGEMLEARRGAPLGTSAAAAMDRLNRWWEKVR